MRPRGILHANGRERHKVLIKYSRKLYGEWKHSGVHSMLWKPGGATYNLFWECPGGSPRGTVTEPRLDRWLTVKEAQCWQDVSCKMSCKDKKAWLFTDRQGAWKHSRYQGCQTWIGEWEARREVRGRGKGQVTGGFIWDDELVFWWVMISKVMLSSRMI